MLAARPYVAPASPLRDRPALSQFTNVVWTTEDGLPQNSITDIMQTRDGYIWLGTEEGLVRFDGVAFEVFNKANTPAFGHNAINQLAQDADGTLWIATDNGLLRYRDALFEPVPEFSGQAGTLIQSVCPDPRGGLWIGTVDGGLTRYRDGALERYQLLGDRSSAQVTSIYAAPNGDVWVGTLGQGVQRFDGHEFVRYDMSTGLADDFVVAVGADQTGAIWVGTRDRGLNRLSGSQIQRFTVADGLPNNTVRVIVADDDGSMWFGTDNGLCRLVGNAFSVYSSLDGLSDDAVTSIIEDAEHNIWVGTRAGGINCLREGKFRSFTTIEGLSSDQALAVTQDREGALWIGTDGGGVNRMRDGEFKAFTSRDGLAGDRVVSVATGRDGSVWVGTTLGLSRIKNGRITNYSDKDGLSTRFIQVVHELSNGVLLVGTAGGGLFSFQGNQFRPVFDRNEMQFTVRSIHESRDGSVWMGTDGNGLFRYKDGELERFTTRDGLSSNSIFAFHEDDNGALWIGTYGGGLIRYKHGRFVPCTTVDGLYNDVAFQILDDGRGQFWMPCNRGVYSVSIRELNQFADGEIPRVRSTGYGKEDGMKGAECNGGQPGGCRTMDGRLWFPTIKGVAMVNPTTIQPNPNPPPVRIERLVVEGKPIMPTGAISIAPGSDKFEFHYTALSYTAPGKVRFRYLLVGYDEAWVDAGTRRVAFYTNIPPGTYTFQVLASNSDGVWTRNATTITFTLEPRFYQTIWFYLLAVIGLVLLGVGISALRVKQAKAREAELLELVEERTRQLAEANEALTKLSLVDGLTEIANRRHFDETLSRRWRVAARNGTPISLLLVDVDFFKVYNDTWGHQRGDSCLRLVAKAIQSSANRSEDLAARYGGEEFAVILGSTNEHGANLVAEALRIRVERLQIEHGKSSVSPWVTVSIGIATIVPEKGSSQTELIRAADAALYEAKRSGRNRVNPASSTVSSA